MNERTCSLTHVALALGVIALTTHAQSSERPRTPVPRPASADIKTEAPPAPFPTPLPAPAAPLCASVTQPAQSVAAPLSNAIRALRSAIDPNKVYFATSGDGAIWARSETYKASFSTRGATYVPFFGSRAPRNYPIAFTLLRVRAGSEFIAFDAETVAQRSENRVQYEREAVRESYDLSPTSVEQNFLLANVPATGDVVLEIGIETELTASTTDEGVRFSNELGSVLYGRPVAIDANGQRADLDSHLVDGVITIRVPRAFLASAALPVTIDPVLSTFAIDESAPYDELPDVVFDAGTLQYGVAYERVYSATDHDVWMQVQSGFTGALVPGSGTYIDFTTNYWAHPGIGDEAHSHKFLVAAQVGDPAGGNRSIWGVVRDPVTSTQSAQFQISDPSVTGDKFNVVVGSDPYNLDSVNTNYAVVWERTFSASDHDIHAQMVQSNATLWGSTVFIDNSTAFDTNPAISRGDDLQDWNIVWERPVSPSLHAIYGARMHFNGLITNSAFPISTSGSAQTHPAVSTCLSGTSVYLVAFEHDEGTQHDILLSLMDGPTSLAGLDLNTEEDAVSGVAFSGQNQLLPAVDSDGTQFAVAYSELQGFSPVNYDVYIADVHTMAGGLIVAEPHQLLASTSSSERFTRIASVTSAGLTGTRYMPVWDAAEQNIEGAFYYSHTGGPLVPFCPGDGSMGSCPCGNSGASGHGCASSVNASGALLAGSGSAATRADSLVLTGSSMPPNTTCLFFQGAPPSGGIGQGFGDGLRCAGGSVIRFGIKAADSAGTAQYPTAGDVSISVRAMIPAAGGLHAYQVWYRNSAAFCTSSAFNLTNGLLVGWTP